MQKKKAHHTADLYTAKTRFHSILNASRQQAPQGQLPQRGQQQQQQQQRRGQQLRQQVEHQGESGLRPWP